MAGVEQWNQHCNAGIACSIASSSILTNPTRQLITKVAYADTKRTALVCETTTMDSLTYDFVVVGGCAVAAGVANTAKKPKVLLIEAGGDNEDRLLRVDGQRWITHANKDMNWGYKTTPQEHCDDRELDYFRGKGLGGSSAVNFGVFTVGARDDYDEWARLVGDDSFGWDKIQPRLRRLETFHGDVPQGVDSKYANPKAENHGTSGPLHVGYAAEWEKDVPPMLDAFEDAGLPLNPDHNSGNPIGMSMLINSSAKGLRSTAQDLLRPQPDNLTVLSSSPVQRIIVEGNKAIGVESNGTRCKSLPFHKYISAHAHCVPADLASMEVILSAGSLDSPKILMHSGIGPKNQLQEFGIAVVKDVPAVGQGLRDHQFCPLVHTRVKGDTDRAEFYGDQKTMDEATEQWKRDQTGPWSKFACQLGVGYFKLDKLAASDEYKALPVEEQAFLSQDTVPHWEIITHAPIHWFMPDFPSDCLNCSAFIVFYYNAQSRGEVTLQSADPNVPLKMDPKFLATPFDRRVAIEALREALRIARHESYSKNSVAMLAGPKSDSDEDLLAHWRQTISSSWHMTGTIKMGQPGDKDAVVDRDFRVMGIDNLRVADMSVVPVLPSCHTQAVAYLTGMTCADKLIAEYKLA
ncbi:glucose-methanol-choline (gmc) oxidoreductase [Purpureocillium lavendulum]|uniref:Glucose-methanol-choline (Gmc) oxidoreductase n=1 Tax=Purpureocillium lavendulum TaxID=1247861 RepID=A0AB34FLS1_9HYPO|nr:glucose-methanol-choline (gmc) oxidoreductase [Purpureocillium lavendulum]